MAAESKVTLDTFLALYCPFGSSQRREVVACWLLCTFVGLQVSLLVFINFPPEWRCVGQPSAMALSESGRCRAMAQGTCQPVFVDREATVTAEFALVCNSTSSVGHAQSAYFGSMLLGGVTSGSLSDRYGRRTALLAFVFVGTFGSVWTAFVESFSAFNLARFLSGFGLQGSFVVAFVLTCECVDTSYRGLLSTLINVAFSAGVVLSAPLCYWLKDSWRHQAGVFGFLLIFPACALWGVCFESPRWLLLVGRYSEAENVLRHFALAAGHDVPDKVLEELCHDATPETKRPIKSQSIFVLFSRPLRKMTGYLLWLWASATMIYYGFTLNMNGLGSNAYVSFFLISLVEIPSQILAVYLLKWYGRRPIIVWGMFLSTVICACLSVATQGSSASGITARVRPVLSSDTLWDAVTVGKVIKLVLSAAGKFTICMSSSVVFVYTAELLPTVIRTAGVGVCKIASRTGGMIIPLLLAQAVDMPSLPYLFFCVFGTLSAIFMHYLPETHKQPLAETLEDFQLQL